MYKPTAGVVLALVGMRRCPADFAFRGRGSGGCGRRGCAYLKGPITVLDREALGSGYEPGPEPDPTQEKNHGQRRQQVLLSGNVGGDRISATCQWYAVATSLAPSDAERTKQNWQQPDVPEWPRGCFGAFAEVSANCAEGLEGCIEAVANRGGKKMA